MDEASEQTVKRLVDSYGPTSQFSLGLSTLKETSEAKCSPLIDVFNGLTTDLEILNEKFSSTTIKNEAVESGVLFEIKDLAGKVKYRMLKSIETVFKEVSAKSGLDEHPGELFQVKSRLIEEGLNVFLSSAKILDLESITELLKNCLKKALAMCKDVSSTGCLNELRNIFFGLGLMCEVYFKFVGYWTKYLVESHRETEKCLYAILYIFGELKTKGFGLPDDFDEEEADERENRNPNRKFELDNQVKFKILSTMPLIEDLFRRLLT